MTKKERIKQIQDRAILTAIVIADVIGFVLTIEGCQKVMANEVACPVAGWAAHQFEMTDAVIETESVEMVEEMYCEREETALLVDSTAYYDSHGYGFGSCGRPLVEGLTIAGRVEWLDRYVTLYEVNEDGSIGDKIGRFQFLDTGYGQATGIGQSKILQGRSVGTIESGQCIDIYFSSKAKCSEWGRRKVYIVIE